MLQKKKRHVKSAFELHKYVLIIFLCVDAAVLRTFLFIFIFLPIILEYNNFRILVCLLLFLLRFSLRVHNIRVYGISVEREKKYTGEHTDTHSQDGMYIVYYIVIK